MANKNLTIKEVETLRETMQSSICDAIISFEDATGMRVGYINTIRKKDMEKSNGCCCAPVAYDADRGPICEVKCNLDMELD